MTHTLALGTRLDRTHIPPSGGQLHPPAGRPPLATLQGTRCAPWGEAGQGS